MTRVRIGVVGCGAIAQVQHLPFVSELAEEFELAAVCDVSPAAARYAAELFHVPRHYPRLSNRFHGAAGIATAETAGK